MIKPISRFQDYNELMNRLFASGIKYSLIETEHCTSVVVDSWICVVDETGFRVSSPNSENFASKATPEQVVFFIKSQKETK